MILPDFYLSSRANKTFDFSGIDSYKECRDKNHFKNFPYEINYEYNSRGFRDEEWPEKNLENCIWCFGDSFTVGIGSPLEHTWVNILQNKTGIRCINISMDGASNSWIYRKAKEVKNKINPKQIVIQWSYLMRDELLDTTLSDEERRINLVDNKNYINNIEKFNYQSNSLSSAFQSTIPKSGLDCDELKNEASLIYDTVKDPTWPNIAKVKDLENLSKNIKTELKFFHDNVYHRLHVLFSAIETLQLNKFIDYDVEDFARDGHHYDIKTSMNFINSLISSENFQI